MTVFVSKIRQGNQMTQTYPNLHTVHPSQQTSLTLINSTKNVLQRAHYTLLQQLRLLTDVRNLTYQYYCSKYTRQYLHKHYTEDTVYQSNSNIV